MPVRCGSEPKQTVTDTDDGPISAFQHALDAARLQAAQACQTEQCDKGKCSYTETKVVGSTWFDPKTKKWTSSQTSSGKCSCSEKPAQPCARVIEQKVTQYGNEPIQPAKNAREVARELARHACKDGDCPPPPKGEAKTPCAYKETNIDGSTWKDSASGKYVSQQNSIGKCECQSQWF